MTSQWLAAANPLHTPASRDEALRAARWGSIALVISACWSAVVAIFTYLNHEQVTAAMIRAVPVQTDLPAEQAEATAAMSRALMSSMSVPMLIISLVMCVVYLVLARVQWTRPNIVIPIVILAFVAYGVFAGLLAMATNPMVRETAAGLQPVWLTAAGWVIQLVKAVLLVASWRGAASLKRFG